MDKLDMNAGGQAMVDEHIKLMEKALLPGLEQLAQRLSERYPGLCFEVRSQPNDWLVYSIAHDVGIWCAARGEEPRCKWIELVVVLFHGFFSSCVPTRVRVSQSPELWPAVEWIAGSTGISSSFVERDDLKKRLKEIPWPGHCVRGCSG